LRASLASFDVLALAGSIAETADGLTQGELHTLDYLACLLAIYDGQIPSWWGFGFSVTDSGAPFAREITNALGGLVSARWVSRDGRVYRLTALGSDELAFERTLAPNRRRVRYLDAAASTALSMPLPTISDALAHEPGLRRALAFMRRKQLLDETSLGLVDDQFAALTEALGSPPGERDDLMMPAVVWLTYLARRQAGQGRAA
jgi:hypothetical protein